MHRKLSFRAAPVLALLAFALPAAAPVPPPAAPSSRCAAPSSTRSSSRSRRATARRSPLPFPGRRSRSASRSTPSAKATPSPPCGSATSRCTATAPCARNRATCSPSIRFEPERLPAGGACSLGFGRTPPAEPADYAFRYDPGAAQGRGADARRGWRRRSGAGRQPGLADRLPGLPGDRGAGRPQGLFRLPANLLRPQDRPIDKLQAGDSLAIGVSNIPPLRQVQLRIVDDLGREWAYARLSSDQKGEVPRTVVWYNTGVVGTTSRRIKATPIPLSRPSIRPTPSGPRTRPVSRSSTTRTTWSARSTCRSWPNAPSPWSTPRPKTAC